MNTRDQEHTNNALHDLTLIKMTVACFVGIGSFLTRYSKGHTK